MLNLFYLEWRRYRNLAIILAILHLCFIAFFNKQKDLLQHLQSPKTYLIYYLIPAFLFGLWQGHSYSKPSQWLYLMHRPIAPRKIGLALSLAGLATLFVVFILPLILNFILAAQYTDRVIDSRHFVWPLSALLITSAAYFCGLLMRISASYWCALLLPSLALIWLAPATGNAVLVPQLLGAAALWWLCLQSFQADRSQSLRAASSMALALVLCQLGAHAALIAAGNFSYELALSVSQLSSHTNDQLRDDSYLKAQRRSGIELIKNLLNDVPEKRILLPQLNPKTMSYLQVSEQTEVHGALTASAYLLGQMNDQELVVHYYNHDRRRFIGFRENTGQRLPDLFPENQYGHFEHLPKIFHSFFLADGSRLYRHDPRQHTITTLFDFGANEAIFDLSLGVAKKTFILTTSNLFVCDEFALTSNVVPNSPIQPRLFLRLPAPIIELENIFVAELPDSFLVSLLYGKGYSSGESVGRQFLYQVDKEGSSHLLAQRTFKDDYPLAYLFDQQLISPVLHTLARQLYPFFNPTPPHPQRPTPVEIQIWAGLLSALSLLAAAVWLKDRTMTWHRRMMLLSFTALGGLPAFVALALVLPRTKTYPAISPTTAQSVVLG